MKITHPIGRVRMVALLEGISFLLLVGVAMPLKYLAGQPQYVKVVGMAHGVLFIALCLVLLLALLDEKLPFRWAVYTFIASLLPFGTFIIDKKLAKFEQP